MSTQPGIDPRSVPKPDPPSNPNPGPRPTPKQPGQPVIDPEDPKARKEKPGPDAPRGPQDLPGEKL
jgi:hypothetical protein